MDVFRLLPGDAPVLASIPHVGTYLPPTIAEALTPEALALIDTDWHLDRLYNFLAPLGIACIQATHSRYVVDLNRPPDDKPLYSGATTGLVSTVDFDGRPLYREGQAPDAEEIARRRDAYWRPYHERLQAELARLREIHPVVVLFDIHSIRSEVPRLFEGRLPDLNIGTNAGAAADDGLAQRLDAACRDFPAYSHVLNGRFKGGYITRAYGQPAKGVHAVQLELSQITYMQEAPPFTFEEGLAAEVRPCLRHFVETLLDWAASAGR